MWSNCIVLSLVVFVVGGSKGQRSSPEDALRKELLKDYNKASLPDKQVNVSVGFRLHHFQMNELLQSIDLDLWSKMIWDDPRLHWDAEKHPDLNPQDFVFDADSLWKPDLTLYNSVSLVLTKGYDVFESSSIIVRPDSVMWVPPAHIKATCVMDMTYWPHDIHNCSVKFGSWVYSQQAMDVHLRSDVLEVEFKTNNSSGSILTRAEWEILDSSVMRSEEHYSCCEEAYVSVTVILVVKRIATVYKWLIKMPVAVLGLMTVVVFLLSPDSDEKVTLSIVTLVINFIFLFAVSNVIGHNSSQTPLIIKLIGNQLVLSGVSVIFSGLILRLVKEPHAKGLPNNLRSPVLALSSSLCLSGYRQIVTAPSSSTNSSVKGENLVSNENGGERNPFTQEAVGGGERNEWILLAAVLDRICLVVFSAIFIINMICYSSVL